MFLEKIGFKKILIVSVLVLTFVLTLTVSPVHAESELEDERVRIHTSTDKGIEATRFFNAKMVRNHGEIYRVTFDAEFTLEIDEFDQVQIEKNFLENYALININWNFFTGFKFDFEFYDNNMDDYFIHTGRVNMISNDELDQINMLGGFSNAYQSYLINIKGESTPAFNPEVGVLRDVTVHEGYKAFPFASSSAVMRNQSYGDDNVNHNYILGEDDEFLNFVPKSVILRFENVSFAFDPRQEGSSVGNGLEANGYFDTHIEDEQNLTNFGYDDEVTADKGMTIPPPFSGLPSLPRNNFNIGATLYFENYRHLGPGVPGDPGSGLIPDPVSGSLFSIIPSIMIAIFSFFWMIGSVELGGIPGLTLVGITTFFVSFMVIKIIIGLFKGGGD